jgi:predicted RNA-binding Zn-ribbon protein involved in translation (DUF1610 family)
MDVISAARVSEESRQCPRRLPTVRFGRATYIVDERLREFRHAKNPHRRVLFDSAKGVRMLAWFYVDVCRSCRQEVAIPRRTAAGTVTCPVCGGPVRTRQA